MLDERTLVIFVLVHGRLFPEFFYPRLLLKIRLLLEIVDIPVFEHRLLRCGCFPAV